MEISPLPHAHPPTAEERLHFCGHLSGTYSLMP